MAGSSVRGGGGDGPDTTGSLAAAMDLNGNMLFLARVRSALQEPLIAQPVSYVMFVFAAAVCERGQSLGVLLVRRRMD